MWRPLLPLVLVFACVDGLISNWMYPATLPLLYRDILVACVFSAFVVQEPVGRWVRELRRRVGLPVTMTAVLFALVGVSQEE